MNYHYKLLSTIAVLLGCVISTSSCVPAAIGVAAGTAAATSQDERTMGTIIDDQGIEFNAQAAINANAEITKDRHVNVTSYNAIVLLSGEVASEQQRELVGNAVAEVRGVRKVHNYLQASEVSGIGARTKDTGITTAIKGRMLAEKELKSLRIKVVTEASVVYLMGIVDSRQSEIATEIARTTRGVQRVVKLFEISGQ